jgi:glutamine amidotransferase
MTMMMMMMDTDSPIDNWVSVPANSIVTIHKQTVLLHPILDEFYSEDLNHDRSSHFAVSKGLVSTAPGTTVQPQGTDTFATPDITVSGPVLELNEANGGIPKSQLEAANQYALSH